MKIKRFEAEDMRAALRRVQEELGADAVILSTESRPNGVCMIAALDYDEALISPVRQAEVEQTPPAVRGDDGPRLQQIEDDLAQIRQLLLPAANGARSTPAPTADTAPEQPILHQIGLDPILCQTLRRATGPDGNEAQLLGQLARRLLTEVPLRSAPALALVGPTGSGKTTTAAKIAARHLMRQPEGSVRLICTDDYRIGGREQIQTFGRLLGASVHTTSDMDEVQALVRQATPTDIVLVDTPGIGPRDSNLAPQLRALGQLSGLGVALCLPAPTHPLDQRTILRRYGEAQPGAVVLTKVDETCRLGMGLSAAIEAELPVAWITDGQRVPQDLHALNADELVARAVSQSQSIAEEADERAAAEVKHACA